MSITKAQFARMIDHTLLKNTAIRKDIELLCSEALEFGFASVCVHPFYVGMCSSSVVDTAHQSGAVVKAIIETSVLNEEQKISACEIVSDAGADFIKTSTGFAGGGATIEDIRLLRSHVDPDIQVKASGGIRTFEQALAMIQAGATRIGTSSGVAMLRDHEPMV